MPQSLAVNYIHLIYSTKHREKLLLPEIRPDLFAYKAAILQEWGCFVHEIGGEIDHVHLLFQLSKNHALVKIIEEVKRSSSKWIKTQGSEFSNCYWQGGYGAFSIGHSQLPRVRRYIRNQEEHHRTMTFQEELRLFLERYNVEYDERYIWE